MKRTVLLFMALLIGIVLPLQSAHSLMYPWESNPWDGNASEDHPWGGDITDPGGGRMQPSGDNGYIQMSIIGRIVDYTMPIILKFYSKRQVSPVPAVPTISGVAPTSPTPSRTIRMTEGK